MADTTDTMAPPAGASTTRRAMIAGVFTATILQPLARGSATSPDADTGLGLLSDSEIRLVACYRQARTGVRKMLEAACDLWPPNLPAKGGPSHA